MNLEYWINDLENIIDPNVTIVLVGNKWDLNEKRAVTFEEGKKFAEEYNLLFYETSAKDNINVHSMFNELASNLKSKVEMGKIPQNMNTKASIVKLHDSNLNIRSDGWSDKVGCII